MAKKNRGRLIAFLFLLILGICWFEPIVWLITNSFKFDADFITSFANIEGPLDYLTRLIPRSWTLSNYTELFFGGANVNTNANITRMFQNSFIVSIAVTVGVVFITSLSAFAYERLNFKGGNKIFWTLMYISMFPNVVAILPQFRIANALGWVNNLNALIWPSIVMTDVNNQTLTAGLRLLMGQYEQRWAHMIASCLVSMLPPFLLYLFAQKYFLQGISVQAGVKG